MCKRQNKGVVPVLILGLTLISLILLAVSSKTYSYDVDPQDAPIHQYITQQAADVWRDMPDEIKQHINRNNIDDPLDLQCLANFDSEDDIIVGSGEEDKEFNDLCVSGPIPPYWENCPSMNEGLNGFFEHFWNPDYPKSDGFNCGTVGGGYNEGLSSGLKELGGPFDSSYRVAQWYWDNKVIPLYISGKTENNEEKINEAYYWLGRTAHLLQDATVPAHVHLLPHDPWVGGKDLYETFVSDAFWNVVHQNFHGSNYVGQDYEYEKLFDSAFWNTIHGSPNPPNLFKLFWYTAQKTQYFAGKNQEPIGDDTTLSSVGNSYYLTWDETPNIFNPSLWENDSVTIIGDPEQIPTNLCEVTIALIPHAMKATAGLYRLFWMEVHPYILSVSLTANPSSGTAPLNGVDLTATVSGTATGTINYTFYCDRSDSGTNITSGWADKYDGINDNPKTAVDVCNYSTPGTYTAKVIAERGALAAESRFNVSVSASVPPQISRSPASLSNSCQEGQNAPSQNFEVWNSGSGTLNYSISDNVGWLSCTPTNGSSTGEHDSITVNYSTSGLSPGTYSATITIIDPAASNSPQIIAVTVQIAVAHALTIINPATGTPNPVIPGGQANLSVLAVDSLGHTLNYDWTASCPTLPSNGILTGTATRTPTWTAPQNSTGSEQGCTIEVTIADGYGLSQQSSYIQKVSPGGAASLSIIDGIRLLEDPPYEGGGKATADATIKNAGSAIVVLDRIQAIGKFTDQWGSVYERSWPAQEFEPPLSLAPGQTYHYTKLLSDSFPGLATTAIVMIYVKFDNIPGQEPVTNSESGATAQFTFEIGHTLDIITAANGTPNPVASGGTVNLNVTATDSLGHGLNYLWTATCPESLGGDGKFSSATSRTPTWTAPQNSTGIEQDCTIEVTIDDGHGLSQRSYFDQGINPVPDTTSPSVAITSPTSNSTCSTSSSSLNIGGTASDTVGVTQVSWSNDRGGSGMCSGTTSWSKTGITLYSGQNIITVTAWDAAGNTGTDTLTVTYTPPEITPTVTTTAPSSITSNSASSGGNVTSDGGAPVTARGVCWSTSENPTTGDSHTSDGSGTGSFTSSITGLSPGTTYHVRAYAMNIVGTAYGSDLTFTTRGRALTGALLLLLGDSAIGQE